MTPQLSFAVLDVVPEPALSAPWQGAGGAITGFGIGVARR